MFTDFMHLTNHQVLLLSLKSLQMQDLRRDSVYFFLAGPSSSANVLAASGLSAPLEHSIRCHRQRRTPDATLLNSVRQFVRQKFAALLRAGRQLASPKDDMEAYCVSLRIHTSRGLRCLGICVDPHPAEVMSEALLHVLPQRRLKRHARTGKHPVDTGGRRIQPIRLP